MPLDIYSYEQTGLHRDKSTFGWPRDREAQLQRLTPFCKPQMRPSVRFSKTDLIFTIGSCFARNVENQLIIEKYNVAARQFPEICATAGVEIEAAILNKFVAHSVANEIEWALDPSTHVPDDIIVEVVNGKYLDMQLAPGFRPMALEKVKAIRSAINAYMRLVRDASVIILTLGLAEAWYDVETKLYLNTPPMKQSVERYPNRFQLHVLDYNDIIAALERLLSALDRFGRTGYRLLLTVSPVAMGSTFTAEDVLVANCYSKSVQRAAAEHIVRKYSQVDYIPTYESVMLSERGLAWKDDCAHVSDEIVRINVRRMLDAYGDQSSNDDEASRAKGLELVRRALALMEAGKIEEAGIAFLEARGAAPDEPIVRLRFGKFLLDNKRFYEAELELKAAYELGAGPYDAAFLYGRVLFFNKRIAEAEPYLQEAVRAQPNRVGVRRFLSRALDRLGRRPEAIAQLDIALATDPDNQSILDEYAKLVGTAGAPKAVPLSAST